MDTRIPKPSGLRMPTKISKPLGDFSNFTKLPEIKSEFEKYLFETGAPKSFQLVESSI